MRRLSLIFLALLLPLAASAQEITLERIMDHPDWIGPPVENARFSLDGRHAIYETRAQGTQLRDTWKRDLETGEVVRVDDAGKGGLDGANPVLDRAGSRALFVRDGDVFLRDLESGTLRQLSASSRPVNEARFSADETRVHYREGQHWFAVTLDSGLTRPAFEVRAEKAPDAENDDTLREMQLRLIETLKREREERGRQRLADETRALADATRNAPPFYLGDDVEIVFTSLSPDERYAVVATQPKAGERGRVGQMPKYVTESGYEETEEVRIRVGRNPPKPHTLRLIDLAERKVEVLALDPLPGIGDDPLAFLRKDGDTTRPDRRRNRNGDRAQRDLQVNGAAWSHDGARVALRLRSIDNKDRWLAGIDFARAELKPLHRLHDPAWINWNFNDFGFLPDGRTLWFLSEESGYGHFYTLPEGARRARQHTRGDFEVWQPTIARDGRSVWLLSNNGDPTRNGVYRLDLERDLLSEVGGFDWIEDYALSVDQSDMLLTFSTSYMPAQLARMPALGGRAHILTDTRTATYRVFEWLEPEFVAVPSRHGAKQPILSKLYRPVEFEPGRRYPVVMFVHGAGYLQNTHRGFPVYFREQMFHNLLVQSGYIVLDMDYRASAGYGRDWRTAIYRQMGHPELEDYLDGIEWLAGEFPIDRGNIGIYGGSYGGFMAFMALFRAPEVFKSGAALRPVSDWAMYNHGYTSNILNTPDLDPEAFRKSSPIEYVENFRGHLLMSHGMIDDNVFYQDVVRLAQRLIELRKHNWELASYPMERHAYQHPESWYDQYRRIYELFESTLK
ncbi:MAG TPA: prolyl oligopeptidase family serine peptidase [Xanthomonadaceae bacterium]|nr:prolyl oligopeptidase family serine peptidase [Xanthomonadaceae bacterium]